MNMLDVFQNKTVQIVKTDRTEARIVTVSKLTKTKKKLSGKSMEIMPNDEKECLILKSHGNGER